MRSAQHRAPHLEIPAGAIRSSAWDATSVGQTHVSTGIHRVQAPPVTALDVRLNGAVAALRLVRCSDAWPRDWLPHPPPPILGQREGAQSLGIQTSTPRRPQP
jgi:hypothetical protein